MARKVGLGFNTFRGVPLAGLIDQTTKLEVKVAGGYDAVNGNSLNTRVVAHRLYKNNAGVFGTYNSATGKYPTSVNVYGTSSDEYYSFISGHVPIISTGTGANVTMSGTTTKYCAQIYTGLWDAAFKSFFNKLEALPWGTTFGLGGFTDGNGKKIPGSEFGGQMPSELWYAFFHEPNIGTSNSNADYGGTGSTLSKATDYARAFKYIMQLYDGMTFAGGKHIKFCSIISGTDTSTGGAYDQFHGVGTSYALTASGGRPLDAVGTDVYFPRPEAGDTTQRTVANTEGTFSGKYAPVRTWINAKFPGNATPAIIGEYAVRYPTYGATSPPAGPDPSYPATWYSGMQTWMNANTLTGSGDHPVRYMCNFCSTTYSNANGGSDNSIIPDQLTMHDTTHPYQAAGISMRPAFTAFHDALIALGNPSLPSATAVTPTLPTQSGVTYASGTFSWTGNGADSSYNVYAAGNLLRNLTGTSLTVFPAFGPMPQTIAYTVTGVASNGSESAPTTATNITFPVNSGVTAPGVPTGLAVTPTVDGGSVSCTATATATGYQWFLDGSGTAFATTAAPNVTVTGLVASSAHTIKVLAFNTGGSSAQSSSVPWTVAGGVDTTRPNTVTGLSSGTVAFNSVPISWSATTDPPATGQPTTGVQKYSVYRSASSTTGSGVLIGTVNATTLSFIDVSPVTSPLNTTLNYYFVTATDGAGNESFQQTSGLAVTVPIQPTSGVPTPVLIITPDTGVLAFGQVGQFDASGSLPGTGGALTTFAWDFGDGATASGSAAVVNHTYNVSDLTTPVLFTLKLTVTDATANVASKLFNIVVVPPTGGTINTGNIPLIIKNTVVQATQVNALANALDVGVQSLSDQVGTSVSSLVSRGNPSTSAARNGGAVWVSGPLINTTSTALVAGRAYVIRAWVLDGSPFTQIKFNLSTSANSATNAFFALYDIGGNLVSPAGALTNAATLFTAAAGIQTYTFDGGPIDPPLGVDDPTNPANEFFIYFYLGTVGATAPQLTVFSNSRLLNMGTTTGGMTLDGTTATLQNAPLFATASNVPSVALNAPATLGTLTGDTNGWVVGLY